mmetsp:Transcript_21525/g.43721  ORF Transcript_21525/g.43721 Transcript_21525/m.43721 type:complete len:232 (-) Transcript_21525:599-1294(-)
MLLILLAFQSPSDNPRPFSVSSNRTRYSLPLSRSLTPFLPPFPRLRRRCSARKNIPRTNAATTIPAVTPPAKAAKLLLDVGTSASSPVTAITFVFSRVSVCSGVRGGSVVAVAVSPSTATTGWVATISVPETVVLSVPALVVVVETLLLLLSLATSIATSIVTSCNDGKKAFRASTTVSEFPNASCSSMVCNSSVSSGMLVDPSTKYTNPFMVSSTPSSVRRFSKICANPT